MSSLIFVALLIFAIGAFISFKYDAGWRSYISDGDLRRKEKYDLVAEKIRAKGELRVLRAKSKAAKTKIDLENERAQKKNRSGK